MRNSYWQVVRGICILGVILIHCLVNGDYNEDTLLLVMRRSINFVVAEASTKDPIAIVDVINPRDNTLKIIKPFFIKFFLLSIIFIIKIS